MMNQQTPSLPPFRLSDAAARRIEKILSEQGEKKAIGLRVSVESGGCNGFRYQFALENQAESDDHVITQSGATVFVDPVSMEYLRGAQLTFIDKLMGAHFAIENPNASASCGCGASFAPS